MLQIQGHSPDPGSNLTCFSYTRPTSGIQKCTSLKKQRKKRSKSINRSTLKEKEKQKQIRQIIIHIVLSWLQAERHLQQKK